MQQAKPGGSFFANPREKADFAPDVTAVGEIRKFIGTGTEYLPVPGCKDVKYVRLGPLILRPQWQHTFLVDTKNTAMEIHSDYQLDCDEFGIPVLTRHRMSNFGIWQQGVEIAVGGVWDEAPPTDEEAAKLAELEKFLQGAVDAREEADPRSKIVEPIA